jgi:hypothetical protein
MSLFEHRKAKLGGAAAMSAEEIGYQAESSANWRRSKAAQFPEDTRNLRAAEELELLARQIGELKGSEILGQIDEAEESLVTACEASDREDVWTDINEAVSSELRSVGFHGSYDGVQFLEWYRDLLRETLQGVLAPEPDLHEQAVNGSSVKRSPSSEAPRKPIPLPKRGAAELKAIKEASPPSAFDTIHLDRSGRGKRAHDDAPLIEALLAIVDAARAYLPPDGIGKDAFIARVLEATDNPRIIAALAVHGHPVAGN